MSHKATTWLSSIPAASIGNSEFRVLFHLCDCHNPSQGCFPTQAYLLDACGVSNGTLNNALNALEAKGLIRRHRSWDGRTKRQKPTRYLLGFEIAAASGKGDPSPETGVGNAGEISPKPSPETGVGAVSKKHPDPTPKKGVSRLQPTGEVTCKEPVNNRGGQPKKPFFTDDERFEARQFAAFVNGGGDPDLGLVPGRVLRCATTENMIGQAHLGRVGIC